MPQPNAVRQRPRGDLRRVQVGRDVDVGHPDEFDQLVDLDEPVVEAHVGLDAQVLGQPLQADPIPFSLLADQVGMGRPQDDVDEVGKLLRIAGIARSICSMPLFGDSSPKVSATNLPSTPN